MSRFRFTPQLLAAGTACVAIMLLVPAEPADNGAAGQAVASTEMPATPAPIATEPAVQAPATAVAAVAVPVATSATAAPAAGTMVAALPADEDDEVAADNATRYAWVDAGGLNVRAGPSAASSKLFVLRTGDRVTVTENDGGWVRVVDDNQGSGWVSARYLAERPEDVRVAVAAPPASPPAADEPQALRLVGQVELRAGPSRSAPQLFALRGGERIEVAETRGNWVRVVMESGASAWINTGDLEN